MWQNTRAAPIVHTGQIDMCGELVLGLQIANVLVTLGTYGSRRVDIDLAIVGMRCKDFITMSITVAEQNR